MYGIWAMAYCFFVVVMYILRYKTKTTKKSTRKLKLKQSCILVFKIKYIKKDRLPGYYGAVARPMTQQAMRPPAELADWWSSSSEWICDGGGSGAGRGHNS